jgi:hypothetical protein
VDSSGWKLFAGYRLLRIVGVEVQYLDLDEGVTSFQAGATYGTGQARLHEQYGQVKVRGDASVLSAVLFFPAIKPESREFDPYGKIGVAKLNSSVVTNTTTYDFTCIPIIPCGRTVDSDVHRSEPAPYVDIGVSMRPTSHFALRLEYEAIFGAPKTTMLSIGFAWER